MEEQLEYLKTTIVPGTFIGNNSLRAAWKAITAFIVLPVMAFFTVGSDIVVKIQKRRARL